MKDATFTGALAEIFEHDLGRSLAVGEAWLARESWLRRAWQSFAATVYRLLERLDVVLGPHPSAETRASPRKP